MPFQILGFWLRPLLTLLLLALGIYLLAEWNGERNSIRSTSPVPIQEGGHDQAKVASDPSASDPLSGHRQPETRAQTHNNRWLLIPGLLLFLWSTTGGWLFTLPFVKRISDQPGDLSKGVIHRLSRPDGTELHVQVFGSPDGIPLILTHGWGLDSHEWDYSRQELESRFRIVVWDLPGLGQSKGPVNKDWSLEKLASDLDAVLTFAGSRPAILAGHSIGGMIILKFCQLFSDSLKARVCGIVLGQTTYTNPVETTSMAMIYRVLQRPVLEPLCYLMIWLSPLVRLMNLWSYCTGSVHRTNHRSFFSGNESLEQLGFISRYSVQSDPSVIARGFLAMFHFDATTTLAGIDVPAMVVAGDRDNTCKPEASAVISASIPRAQLITLQSARHGGVFEFHKRFAEVIHQMTSTIVEREEAVGERGVLISREKLTA